MRRLATLFLAAAITLSQVGCGIMAPTNLMITHDQAATLDFGPYPNNYKEILSDFIREHYKDPDSAKVDFMDNPVKATYDAYGIGLPRYGWGGVIRINAKNSYGAYTGYKDRQYLIWNGRVIYYQGTPIGSALKQPMPAGGPKARQGAPAIGLRFF